LKNADARVCPNSGINAFDRKDSCGRKEGKMLEAQPGNPFVADVKCYYCGHVGGQVIGRRNEPLRPENFLPRPGYSGPEMRAGERLRCERCRGPVFLEEAGPIVHQRLARDRLLKRRLAERRKALREQTKAA
jgi:hypothetical protein